MSSKDTLEDLKAIARRLERPKRIQHTPALNLVAEAMGFPHWKAVVLAERNGWRPSSEQLEEAKKLVEAANPFDSDDKYSMQSFFEPPIEGELLGHKYKIATEFDDVLMGGPGWTLSLSENPKLGPVFWIDERFKATPLNDEAFRKAAVEVARAMREKVHARMASDWPRRSTVLAADGKAEHPLFNGVSDTWFCLHCDGKFTGRQMAENMWHCPAPGCDGSPNDIFAAPFWNGDKASPA